VVDVAGLEPTKHSALPLSYTPEIVSLKCLSVRV
jgi:hypothetical protein